jgi:hypothetical protein
MLCGIDRTTSAATTAERRRFDQSLSAFFFTGWAPTGGAMIPPKDCSMGPLHDHWIEKVEDDGEDDEVLVYLECQVCARAVLIGRVKKEGR